MKTQHTSGPWFKAGKGQNIEVRYKTGVKLCGVETDDLICMLPHYPDKNLHSQYEANAALIAAAPELLEALREVTSELEAVFKWQLENNRISDVVAVQRQATLDKARSAIAKARGETL